MEKQEFTPCRTCERGDWEEKPPEPRSKREYDATIGMVARADLPVIVKAVADLYLAREREMPREFLALWMRLGNP